MSQQLRLFKEKEKRMTIDFKWHSLAHREEARQRVKDWADHLVAFDWGSKETGTVCLVTAIVGYNRHPRALDEVGAATGVVSPDVVLAHAFDEEVRRRYRALDGDSLDVGDACLLDAALAVIDSIEVGTCIE